MTSRIAPARCSCFIHASNLELPQQRLIDLNFERGCFLPASLKENLKHFLELSFRAASSTVLWRAVERGGKGW